MRAVRATVRSARRPSIAASTMDRQVAIGTVLAGASVGLALTLTKARQARAGSSSTKGTPPVLQMDEITRTRGSRTKSFLYSRSGDTGTSMLFNGERRSKQDQTFDALGATDELNAAIGLAREYSEISGNGLADLLREVQSRLMDLMAQIATPRDVSSESKKSLTEFPSHCTDQLEACIDELDARVPPLKTFILPGGGLAAAHLHMARCVCRRAERCVQPLREAGQVGDDVSRYMNRLSDFLFAAARYASHVEGQSEVVWQKLDSGDPAEEKAK